MTDDTSGSVLQRLAAHISGISVDDLEQAGANLIRVALVDTLGVTLAGSTAPGARALRSLSPAAGPSLVLGTTTRLGALDAGMANGVAAHALDYDDGNLVIVGHPSTVLVPAILALGEEVDASAADLAVAYGAGYEAMIRLARGINTTHYERGWHPTSTLGVFGAAAAGARLLSLDPEATTTALALAASMAAGIKSNFGTMAKALHVGHAVRDGLMCAVLAANGYTANPYALEARQGFFDVYNGPGNVDIDAIFDDGLAGLEVNRGLNPIKGYPCCHSTHSAVDAARELRARGLDADDVKAIEIEVDPMRMPHTDRPVLDEALSGKFSLQYVVSRALLTGNIVLDDFTGEAHRNPRVLELMRRVTVIPATSAPATNSFAATVRITTSAGERLTAFRDPLADGVDYHAHPPMLWDKFSDCAGQVLPSGQVDQLVGALHAFPAGPTTRDLVALCEADPSALAVHSPADGPAVNAAAPVATLASAGSR